MQYKPGFCLTAAFVAEKTLYAYLHSFIQLLYLRLERFTTGDYGNPASDLADHTRFRLFRFVFQRKPGYRDAGRRCAGTQCACYTPTQRYLIFRLYVSVGHSADTGTRTQAEASSFTDSSSLSLPLSPESL